jgi:hypothetical protein
LSFVKQENIAYPACTLQYNGKQCNKKVTDNGGEGSSRWFCERCNASCEADWRYMLSIQIEDHSGKEWVTAFQVQWPLFSGPLCKSRNVCRGLFFERVVRAVLVKIKDELQQQRHMPFTAACNGAEFRAVQQQGKEWMRAG